jgi:thiol-disulfide isomerase/thioredoxin
MAAKRVTSGVNLLAIFLAMNLNLLAQSGSENSETKPAKSAQIKKSDEKSPPAAKISPESEELQKAINGAGTDRAALVRNLEAHLAKYPDSAQRPQIYRALVEAHLQLRDTARAAEYAERIVALTPDDMSIMLVAIQLLQRSGDEAGLKRAVNYATRVLAFVERTAMNEKSPQMSAEEWTAAKARDRGSVLLLRGQLYLKLTNTAEAQKDFAASYDAFPTAGAAVKLGEVAELNKDSALAIKEYALAFALAEGSNSIASRREIRQKIGNVWRLAHGSDAGLGDYLLHSYDEVSVTSAAAQPGKNAEAREAFQFTVRKAPGGELFSLAATKGNVLVISFWATWCGPCRAQEPQFERVASRFRGQRDVTFLMANCDEDETLVPPYLEEVKPRTQTVFADGLDRLFAVKSFPTVIVVDRQGKIIYRTEGFGDDSFERDLTTAARSALASAAATGGKLNSSP